MITWGVSAASHDAAVAVFDDNKLVFASHSERFSKKKNDGDLHPDLIKYALEFGRPGHICYYEKPLVKATRQLYAGQQAFPLLNVKDYIQYYCPIDISETRITNSGHHRSHAAAGYFTSGFDNAVVIVLDAIGEWDTGTIWEGNGTKLKKRWSMRYPHSVGLWYSAMTQRCGFKPNEEEYIMMGMAASGDPRKYYDLIREELFDWRIEESGPVIKCAVNMHRGIKWWREDIKDVKNLAAAAQKIYEDLLTDIVYWTYTKLKSKNLILMGGCALNCVANGVIANKGLYDKIWIMPNPGDAGSSVGAVLSVWNKHIEYPGAFLGYNIKGEYPVQTALQELLKGNVVAVANGPAEFGPRALGNRSLLIDPRLSDSKERMNKFKKREPFRPFAPAILAEHVNNYFEMPYVTSPYMQYTAQCKTPDYVPGAVHIDGSSRVQTVTTQDSPGFRALLEAWYSATGCPILLNTSMNIKGQPLVNDEFDAAAFSKKHKIAVLTKEEK